MGRACHVLRVFTRDGGGGNHLGVVTESAGLAGAAMQTIAADLGFSETIFCDRTGPTPSVRIFTPGAELPFAGHPLVGMNWLLSELDPPGPAEIECGIGRVGCRVEGGVAWVDVPLDQPVVRDVGLPGYDPGTSPVSVDLVEMPLPYHMIEVSSPAGVQAAPMPGAGMVAVYAWVDDATVHTRFFAPGHGVEEDPATGSAAVALAASLRARGRPEGVITILQGEEIGFPSEIRLHWGGETAAIGGRVVRDGIRELEM